VRRTLVALLLVAVLPVPAPAGVGDGDRLRLPDLEAADLLDVSLGDSLARVLAVVHNEAVGAQPTRVRILELSGHDPLEVPDPGRDAETSRRSFFVAVASACARPPRPGGAPDFDSWFFLPANALAAWSLQTYTGDCRPEPPLVETSDHEAMRVVGDRFFRRVGRGRFPYGPLRYEDWDDAFAAPSRKAALSLLQARAVARPRDARAQNRLAVALYAAGERDGAIQALRRAAELDPAWDLPHRNLAVVHQHRGETAAADHESRLADTIGELR
jgi:hypothetical protein